MAQFYATSEDLLPLLASVESHLDVKYTPMGISSSKVVQSWHHGNELPTIGVPSPNESAISGPSYLVTLAATPVTPRLIRTECGDSWVVDQLQNPDSTVLLHGGRYEQVLLYGRVATASRTPGALKLQRVYEAAIRRSFARVQAFYVGEAAEALLDSGFRLTIGAKSPPEYDLSRQGSGA